jgi:mRNA-degrading endonuclease toxin of MazEF toxin-antitoxin module
VEEDHARFRRATFQRESLTLREERCSRKQPRRGEIWEVNTPGHPEDPHQPRPALVISEDERNQAADDFLVVPIFSRGRGPTRVPLPAGEGGIERDSVIFCEEVTCLYEDFLVSGPLGISVRQSTMRSVVNGVVAAITSLQQR